ncbi:MAG TPA: hypothetical protein VGB73_04590 [Pyrinomonadaceae bacterium]|jgi:hypothetical protein
MFKNSLVAVGQTTRGLFKNWSGLSVLHLLYAALLASVYLFFSTKEATLWQLTLTASLALLAPLLFFILQAAAANFAQGDAGALALLRRALADFFKLLLVSLPLVALAVLVVYLLNKLQAYFPARVEDAAAASRVPYPQTPPPPPMRWQDVLLTSLRLVLLGVLLPLVAIQLWLSVARDGLKATLKRAHRVVGRAFAPQPIFVYAIGLLVFGLMPYFLIFTRTPVKNSWGELIIFGLRLALAFVFTLWGWLITLGALAKINADAQTGATPGTSTTNVTHDSTPTTHHREGLPAESAS